MSGYTLEQLNLVDAPDEKVFDNLTHLASYITGAPVSLVTFVQTEKNRQYFKSQVGLTEPWSSRRQTPLSHSFCQHVVQSNSTLIIDNAPDHPLVANNLAIPDLGVYAYLGTPIYGSDSTPLGALCVVEGSPRKWDERAISHLEKLAFCVTDAIRTKILYKRSEEMRAEQREFTYAISHDLKAPLTTMSYLIDEIKNNTGSNFTADALNLLQLTDATILRSKSLIEDILKFTRTLHTDDEFQIVDLNELFLDIQHNLKGELEQSGAVLNLENLPEVTGNPMQLRLLFQNIVHNAIKFRKSNVQPLINIESTDSNENTEVRITDNGIGISSEYHNKIFNLFQRLHTQEEHPGSGIGLTLAHRVAANHGGSIKIESEPRKGTTFKVQMARSA